MATVLDYNPSTNSLSISSSTGSKPVIVPVAGSGIDNNFSVAQTFGAAIIQPASAGANNQTPFLQAGDMIGAYVVDGLLDTVPSTASLTSTMPGGTAYVQGGSVLQRVVSPGATYTYAASSDTYVDLSYSGVFTYSAVANGSTAPAVAADSLRLEKVVTDATAITGVTQLAPTAPNAILEVLTTLDDAVINGANIGLGAGNIATNFRAGNQALYSNTSGTYLVAVGAQALYYNTIGVQNTAVGQGSGYNNISGSYNVFIGTSAANTGTDYSSCTIIGSNSGNGPTSGNENIIIGYNSNNSASGLTNETVIGVNLTGYGSHTSRMGGRAGFYTDGRLIPANGSSLDVQTLDSTTTAGALTTTAAQMLAGFFTDGATQTAAFTITTDTAANVYAAAHGLVGSSFKFRIFNNDQSSTGYPFTLAAGTGVTIGTTLPNPSVPKGSWCDYLAIFTSVGASPAITINAVGMGTF